MRDLSARALKKLKRGDLLESRAFVDGSWRDAAEQIAVVDPATQEAIASVASLPLETVDEAVAAAVAAQKLWRERLPVERGRLLRDWAAAMRSNSDDLAVIMTAEQGKPIAESHGEIAYAAAFLDWFAGEGERSYGETIPSHLPGSRLSVQMQPIGVAAAVTPWNFPSAMIIRKAGAALAAGCAMVVKPAPETPLSALALAKLAEEVGFPKGVFQVLTGEAAPMAHRLLAHTEIRAFSFTGSTEVGRLLLGQAAQTVKRTSLELGGHAPFIVFDDAPLEQAVIGGVAAKFATSGQDCLAANRIYVQRGVYERFVAAYAEAAARLKLGHGVEEGVDIGPMTRPSVAEKCRQQIAQALAAGARIVAGGQDSPLGGSFVQPT